jgi:hypothetical protein
MEDRLIGLWCPSFSGATQGILPDLTGKDNNGILTNTDRNTAWVTGEGKLALSFNGTNNQVNLSSSILLSTRAFTLSFWALQIGAGAIGMPLGNRLTTNSFIWFRSGNYLRFDAPNLNNEFQQVTTFTNWAHYVLTGSVFETISTIGLIVNGTGRGQINSVNTNFTLNTIGAGYAGNFWFPGQIDDVRVFEKPLTNSESRSLYQLDRGGGLLHEPPKRRAFFVPALPLPVRRRSSRFLGFPG